MLELRLELINDGPIAKSAEYSRDIKGANYSLALKVEDLDAGSGRGAQPVAVGREYEGVDNIASLERVEVLALVEIPEHGNAVLAARSSKGAIGRDGDGVDVPSVSVVVGLQLELLQFPDLKVPSAPYSSYRCGDDGSGSEILVIIGSLIGVYPLK